ncbi:MAG: NAD(P)/FAD-dependent oxidoreductase [Clostridia bacterium]|nr:NAD(P)/FAD-dependent oxidoreductase [Clostridia bacterium]
MYDTAIIGGGASGLAAAIMAARRGKSVLLLERLPRVGKKILSTGNGRCNITNAQISPENYHGTDASFSKEALSKFPVSETMAFFASLGLPLWEGENGKLYPKSLQATSVLDLMRLELTRLGVAETVDTNIVSLSKKGDGFLLKSEDGRSFSSKNVICAFGGKAAPSMGTDGAGYSLLTKMGHKLIKPLPSLCQLKTENPMRALKGVKHEGEAAIYIDGKAVRTTKGEILFTDYGISGPPVFNLSRMASEGISTGRKVTVSLNLMPEYTEDGIFAMLRKRRQALPHLDGESFLYGMLPKLLGREVLKRAKNDRELAYLLHSFPLTVSGVMPWANAQVTAGGIDTKDVNPQTMESRLVPGLYLIGELLDVDGDCGGYNLQWAWSSAYMAANAI